jgi:nucleobase:cation symporter-1, NCS1 family
VNPRAIFSLLLGIVIALLGLAIPPLRWLYDYAWFVGFAVSALAYLLLMRGESIAVSDAAQLPELGGQLGD